jgi:histidine triad (HIT) family protein
MTNCIFCKIARKEIPSQVVYEDDDVFAFHDINPQAPVHIVVIPKRHIVSLLTAGDNDQSLLGKLALVSARVAQTLGLAENGFRVVINIGRDGGQSVEHLHYHILGGRSLTWPPG